MCALVFPIFQGVNMLPDHVTSYYRPFIVLLLHRCCTLMYQLRTAPSTLLLANLIVLTLFQKLEGKKANAHAIIQSFVLPNRKLRKTAAKAEAQYKIKIFFLLIIFSIAGTLYYLFIL